jgi:hypothetical protein
VLGDVEAIVEVGVVLVVAALAEPVEPVEDVLEDDEPLMAGDGDTIDTGAVELDDDEVVDPDEEVLAAVDDDDPADDVAEAGLVLSLGTPLANGLRAMRASTTLAGSLERAGVVDVWLAVVVAAGGAGGNVLPPAGAPLSSSTGTATRAATRSATSGQSLRSSRSRRSALIPGLPWRCSTCSRRAPTRRWMR